MATIEKLKIYSMESTIRIKQSWTVAKSIFIISLSLALFRRRLAIFWVLVCHQSHPSRPEEKDEGKWCWKEMVVDDNQPRHKSLSSFSSLARLICWGSIGMWATACALSNDDIQQCLESVGQLFAHRSWVSRENLEEIWYWLQQHPLMAAASFNLLLTTDLKFEVDRQISSWRAWHNWHKPTSFVVILTLRGFLLTKKEMVEVCAAYKPCSCLNYFTTSSILPSLWVIFKLSCLWVESDPTLLTKF